MAMFSPIEEIITELAAGRMVIVVDDEDRENEGDLLMAADAVTADDINFMAKHGRGLICLTLTREHCERLRLPLMVSSTHFEHRTNFTLSIEAASGVTTGISAKDRAHTVRTAVKEGVRPEDIRQPGHIFPVMAHPGGVLTRAGHTEAGCDLARLAKRAPSAVICEIMNEDGSMARRDDLMVFAKVHGLKIGTIADLIRYRLTRESTVARRLEKAVQTQAGPFTLVAYDDLVHHNTHVALVHGDVQKNPPLVRVQLEDTLRDAIGIKGLGRSTHEALESIRAEASGVVVLLRYPDATGSLIDKLGGDGDPAESRVLRTYGIGAQILKDLGVSKMRVLSAPVLMTGLAAFDIEVIEYVDR